MKNSVEQSSKADKVQTRVMKHKANFASLNVIAMISVKQHFIIGFFFFSFYLVSDVLLFSLSYWLILYCFLLFLAYPFAQIKTTLCLTKTVVRYMVPVLLFALFLSATETEGVGEGVWGHWWLLNCWSMPEFVHQISMVVITQVK